MKTKPGCAVAVGLCVLTIAYAVWSQIFVHDYMLCQLDKKYAAIRHPGDTQHVRSYKDLGLLIGNGNHCDLFVGELRSYTGSRRQVLDGYTGRKFWSPAEQASIPIEVLFVEKGQIVGGRYWHGEIGFDLPYPVKGMAADASKLSTSKDYYIVYYFDAGYSPGLDIRCQ